MYLYMYIYLRQSFLHLQQLCVLDSLILTQSCSDPGIGLLALLLHRCEVQIWMDIGMKNITWAFVHTHLRVNMSYPSCPHRQSE